MTFTDQWANRHDPMCENVGYMKMVDGQETPSLICHCYRRWLEERLGALLAAAQQHECDASAGCELCNEIERLR